MYTKRSLLVVAVIMFIAGILFTAKCNWLSVSAAKEYFHESPGQAPMAGTPGSFAPLVRKVSPAVVNVFTTKKVNVRPFNPFKNFGPRGGGQDPFEGFFDRFFDGQQPMEREQHSLGSGFVINEDGFILTNNHVVAEADEINVQFSDEKKYIAKVIGTDEKTDVAIIKVKADKPLPFVQLGDSDKLDIGDWVVAVGNPFGLDHTVTAGIVGAKGRNIKAGPYDNFIQIDASINPGNSGGPLFNTAGEVVGINTAIFSAGQGLGFAIPINMAKKLIPQLVEKGKITDRGWLGVQFQEIDEALAKSFGMDEPKGGLVGDVIPGSPAEKAGLKRGDIILSFDGKNVKKSSDLPGIVASTDVGKTVKMEIMRDGKKQTLDVTLGKQQIDESKGPKGAAETEKEEAKKPDIAGLVVRGLTPEEAHELGATPGKGILITRVEPGSSAEDAGIRSGDLLLEVGGKPITSAQDYQKVASGLKKGDVVRFLIRRGNSTVYVAFKI
jgi:serine protease Do